MTSIDGLRDEHRRIEAMLSALDAVAERLDRDEAAPAFVEELIEFFRLFADARHHAKEEQRLFPLLAGGDSSYGVIDALRHHHDLGRMLVGEMRQALTHLRAGDPTAARMFAASARSYTHLLRVHIDIEEHQVFAEAGRTLTATDERTLREAFEGLDTTPAALQQVARWERLAEQVRATSVRA